MARGGDIGRTVNNLHRIVADKFSTGLLRTAGAPLTVAGTTRVRPSAIEESFRVGILAASAMQAGVHVSRTKLDREEPCANSLSLRRG